MTDTQWLGAKLKSLRKAQKLTLKALSEKSEISTGYLSKIERGAVNPSVSNIQKICFALGITANELMIDAEETKQSDAAHAGESYVLRKTDRVPIYGITDSLDFEFIFEDAPSFKINAMTLAAGTRDQSYSMHSYDEFGIVAKGCLGVTLEDTQSYTLEEGDCIMVRANTKHTVTNLSEAECVSYWIELKKDART